MSTYAMYGEVYFAANNGRPAIMTRRINDIKIESSWRSLTDTADITLPRNVRDYDRQKISEVFHEGDPVEIWLGYNGSLTLEFSGYISKVPAGVPLIIRCEDEMYKLKRTLVSVSIKNCTLKSLLQKIAPGYTITCDETKLLGSVRYSKWSASNILDDLKKAGIHCWFEGKILHAFSTSKSDLAPVSVLLEKTAGESLKQKTVEDTLVTISLLQKIGKKIKVEYGEKSAGVKINRQLSGVVMSKTEMLNEAKKIYAQAKTPGLDGDVTLFGVPHVQHGMKLKMRSTIYPEKDGTYYIDAVTKTFNNQGYRQVCKLADKAL
jgi:hypothetical protein